MMDEYVDHQFDGGVFATEEVGAAAALVLSTEAVGWNNVISGGIDDDELR